MQKKIDLQFEDKLTVRNTLNARYHKSPGEKNDQPSMTVPDQAMGMKEILRRFAAGIPMDAGRVPLYEPDNDLPDPRYMDLADREELAQQFQEEIATIRKTHASQQSSHTPVPGDPRAQAGEGPLPEARG